MDKQKLACLALCQNANFAIFQQFKPVSSVELDSLIKLSMEKEKEYMEISKSIDSFTNRMSDYQINKGLRNGVKSILNKSFK